MGYELRTKVVEPKRNTYTNLIERFGDKPASRYQEGSYNIQPMENFHYRPTWDPAHNIYDPDFSALKLTDPYGYSDPRQMYYAPYVTDGAQRHEAFGQTLKYIEQRRLLDKMPESFQIVLTNFVLPLRHYESGANLLSIAGTRFAWGTTVEQPMIFSAFDRMGNAQQLTLIGLALAGGAGGTLAEAKRNWMYSPQLQPLRRIMEELLIEKDWAIGIIGLDLIDVQLYPMLYAHLDDRSLGRGAMAYSLLARHFYDWHENNRKWLVALYKAWVNDSEHGDANKKLLQEIVNRWYPPACAAVHSIAQGITDLAGSTTILAAAERGAAEVAAKFAAVGIPVASAQGAAA
jgi:phenol hydroxylase P1 protein